MMYWYHCDCQHCSVSISPYIFRKLTISVGLRDLLKELQSVTDWRKLGLHLDVPEPKLDDIQESNSGNTDDCRREMFMAWMDLEVPTWARVVHALIHIGLPVLAAEIARNHGKHLTSCSLHEQYF